MLNTLIIGSGAAGLNAAIQLRAQGIADILVVTEGLAAGTSINTGSDKQTYYKLGLVGDTSDSPVALAQTLFDGGSMHGDIALAEAALSARAFYHLVALGVPFPCDEFGQYAGYKTDHDPARRATSIGPYTSREMCRALIRRAHELGIEIREHVNVVELITLPHSALRTPHSALRVAGAIVLNAHGEFETILAENVVFATGGPGGLYDASVYPAIHTGAIGVALMAGAKAQNLAESQFGMASVKFRWNVSGSYMQCVPRFISTAADGTSDAREFLDEYLRDSATRDSLVFLKGYQWPFDVRKVRDGSSLIDILVYIETVTRGRRVFLDFRQNAAAFDFARLSDEAREYLEKSGATGDTPFARLDAMNPGAIALYRDHAIDIATEPLEIAVCAQHNNGGLAATHRWESTNIAHLFPVGEVNGSHGVTRPGGSALNAGQVGGFRAAEYIANKYHTATLDEHAARDAARALEDRWRAWAMQGRFATRTWKEERDEFRRRMTRAAALVRDAGDIENALAEADAQMTRLRENACVWETPRGLAEACRNVQLCHAHCAYLSAIAETIRAHVGSRGSALVRDPSGEDVNAALDATWRMIPEDASFREKVLVTSPNATPAPDSATRAFSHTWIARREIPGPDLWFENVWRRFREKTIYEA